MSLPYRWHPVGAKDKKRPEVGDLVAHDHRVWRVMSVRLRAEVDWSDEDRTRVSWYVEPYRSQHLPAAMILRPIEVTSDDPRSRDHDKAYRLGGAASWYSWPVFPNEHYPVCAQCHEPVPCRDQMAETLSHKASERMSRYEMAGVCPSCGEVVTRRQQSLTWPDNAEVPGGPPVTFHMRRQCRGSAHDYEKRWVAMDPNARRAKLSCPGHVTNHNDGTYECSELVMCPGPTAYHQSLSTCRCPDCHARGAFGCHPSPTARLALPGEA